jgi:uncharacterized lipoprotein YddW (UPF0748 family)
VSARLLRPLAWAAVVALLAACGESSTEPTGGTPVTPTPITVPGINREFRGMWIATVANIDWPSRNNLTAAQQQTELSGLLDVAQAAGLNAVVLQVRAAGDLIYPSTLEPWARSLTGTQGTDPGYDPMSYAVAQARQRGIELHAWFNPFRAGNLSDTSRLASSHLAKRRPDVTRPFCTQLWFDPAEQVVQDQAIAVIREVVQRYDVDAVHLDDFFYPYPDTRCPGLDFPDSAGYAAYKTAGGTLSRDDWRRDNVNRFVERLYREVHAASPTARVGISPFGIWRPGNPTGIVGLDAYGSIYADSRKWLQSGWVDYLAPQLYWSLTSTGQNFTSLITWWGQQNTMRRHLWPGLASYRVNDGSTAPYAASEIPGQVAASRAQSQQPGGSTGTILYNGSSVRDNRGGFVTQLTSGAYSAPALPPATTWLDGTAPAPPTIAVKVQGATATVTITAADGDSFRWLVRWRANSNWQQKVVHYTNRTVDVPSASLDAIVVNALDRVGNASTDVTWRP